MTRDLFCPTPSSSSPSSGVADPSLPQTASVERPLSRAEFQRLQEVPALIEWLANIENPNTRRAYASDVYELRRGIPTLAIHGKGSRIRYLPVHPSAATLIEEYLESAGHRAESHGPLFRPVRNPGGTPVRPLTGSAVCTNIVRHYAIAAGTPVATIHPHCLRATARTNAPEHGAEIAKVRDWLSHRTVSTTQLCDNRKTRPEDSPTFRIRP